MNKAGVITITGHFITAHSTIFNFAFPLPRPIFGHILH